MAKTILLVDDFENTLFFTATTLEKKGYNVVKATSGKEALKLATNHIIDLLITDYNMPEMNGLALVEEFKKVNKNERVPVFVLSTEIKQEVKDHATKIGVTAWIKKPFELEKLLKLIEKITQ